MNRLREFAADIGTMAYQFSILAIILIPLVLTWRTTS